MPSPKVRILTRGMPKEQWDVFQAGKPAEFTDVKLVNPDDGEAKVAVALADADLLICSNSGIVSPKILEKATKLKIIQVPSQGTEYLPGKWALEKGIPVCNAGGANAISVAEHATMLMLICLKQFIRLNQGMREGKFRGIVDRKDGHELYGRTVGIIGFGNIGRRIAKLVYGFGANVIYNERFFVPYALRADMKAKPVTLDELLAESDIVTVHVPAMSSNKALIGWEQLNKMKKSAYLINTSRGANVDEQALVRALNEKVIAGAGLDVFEKEPTDPKNPLIFMPNVAVSPHAAANTWENWVPTVETVWSNLERVAHGQPPLNQIREF